MFTLRFDIFRIFGIPIRLDISWFLVFALIAWTLAVFHFPMTYEGLETSIYWMMGVAGALGLFISVLLHELGHAVTAQRYGIRMNGITLFIFGGVAEMQDEPPSARAEFWVAIAGPIVSIVLCGLGIGAALIGSGLGGPEAVVGVIWWLGLINGILVVFNMIPAFPLDGGRVLRAILWAVRADLRWATRITSAIGSGFGILLIVFGVFGMIGGAIIPGLWFILIGFFLRSAAQASYQQLLVRRALEGEPVRRFMTPEPITVGPDLPLDRLVSDYIYRHYHKMYPVTDGDRVIGCVSTRAIKALPAEQWSALTVADVLEDCSEDNAISADADAMDALGKMNRMQASRLMVMENGHLAGIVSLKDLMRFLSLKIELEEEMGGRGRVTQPPSLPEAERWPPDVGR